MKNFLPKQCNKAFSLSAAIIKEISDQIDRHMVMKQL